MAADLTVELLDRYIKILALVERPGTPGEQRAALKRAAAMTAETPLLAPAWECYKLAAAAGMDESTARGMGVAFAPMGPVELARQMAPAARAAARARVEHLRETAEPAARGVLHALWSRLARRAAAGAEALGASAVDAAVESAEETVDRIADEIMDSVASAFESVTGRPFSDVDSYVTDDDTTDEEDFMPASKPNAKKTAKKPGRVPASRAGVADLVERFDASAAYFDHAEDADREVLVICLAVDPEDADALVEHATAETKGASALGRVVLETIRLALEDGSGVGDFPFGDDDDDENEEEDD